MTQDYYYAIEEKLVPDAPEKPFVNVGQSIDEGVAPEEMPQVAVKPEIPAG